MGYIAHHGNMVLQILFLDAQNSLLKYMYYLPLEMDVAHSPYNAKNYSKLVKKLWREVSEIQPTYFHLYHYFIFPTYFILRLEKFKFISSKDA